MQAINPPSGVGQPVNAVSLNAEQQLYVIASGSGFSCLGFDNARAHANQIAQRLKRTDLSFTPSEYATLAGYRKYEAAVCALGKSTLRDQTYFEPGTDCTVIGVLKSCLNTRCKVRLILGDTSTGAPWLEEFDVVGTIGRSCGTLKVPLLLADGESCGSAILTTCILEIVDWKSGRSLYRHPAYQEPDLRLKRTDDADHPWAVEHESNRVIARFRDAGKAGAYLAFMRGETVEPRIFQ